MILLFFYFSASLACFLITRVNVIISSLFFFSLLLNVFPLSSSAITLRASMNLLKT